MLGEQPEKEFLHMAEVLRGSFVPKTPKPLCAKMGDPCRILQDWLWKLGCRPKPEGDVMGGKPTRPESVAWLRRPHTFLGEIWPETQSLEKARQAKP